MNDCPNADVRDLLPDLVHQRLDAETRAMVEAHVGQCADCSAELELLRQLRAVRSTPRVDVASIVGALPAYRAPARRSWVSWRAAAAITVLVAGASSVAVIQRGVPSAVDIGSRPITAPVSAPVRSDTLLATPHVAIAPTVTPKTSTPIEVLPAPVAKAPESREGESSATGRELAMGGGAMSDLDDRQLKSLLKDIESLDAVPSVEVESTPVSPIAPSAQSRP